MYKNSIVGILAVLMATNSNADECRLNMAAQDMVAKLRVEELLGACTFVSHSGANAAMKLLHVPISDRVELDRRQCALQRLPAIRTLEHTLTQLGTHERIFLTNQNPDDAKVFKEIMERYASQLGNNSGWFKTLFLGRFGAIIPSILSLISQALPYSQLTAKAACCLSNGAYQTVGGIAQKSFRNTAFAIASAAGPFTAYLMLRHYSPSLSVGYQVLSTLGMMFGLYSTVVRTELNYWYPQERRMHDYIRDLILYMQEVERLIVTLDEHPEIAWLATPIQEAIVQLAADPDAYAVLAIARSKAMKESHAFFSNVGNVVRAYKHFTACRDLFDHLRKAVGAVEAYWAFGKFVLSHSAYCFVQYTEKNTELVLTQMQHPILAFNQATIANDIAINAENGTQFLCITGANRSGKSTCAKAVLANIWLAQTVGICCAQVATLQPYTFLGYMHRVDDRLGQASTFEQELYEIDAMVTGAVDTRNSASFIVMDEPLVSTQPSAAIESLEMVFEKFVQRSNVQGIVVTHYVGVGAKQPGIEQWHMETLEASDILTPTYSLKSGLSYQNDAAAMMRARFDTTTKKS
jgi:hypothetical protein